MMNFDEFEERLQRQPVRQVPPEWRAQILANAHEASLSIDHQVGRVTPCAPRFEAGEAGAHGVTRPTYSVLLNMLWPTPKAWASLAAIWLALLIVNVSTIDKSSAVADAHSRPAPAMIMVWREREDLLRELLAVQEMPVAERPKPAAPGPRSERHIELVIG